MLEKLGFEELVHETVNLELRRQPRSMAPYQFLIGMILAVYVGFSRLEARLRNGDKPSGEDIARHLRLVIEHLPKTVKKTRTRIVNANSPIDRKAGTRHSASLDCVMTSGNPIAGTPSRWDSLKAWHSASGSL